MYDGPEPVPDELLEKAVKKVQEVAKGNGMRGIQVALGEFEGEIIKFETYELFKMDPQIAEKRAVGKQAGETAGSLSDMRTKMQMIVNNATINEDVKKLVISILKKRKDIGFALENQTITFDTLGKTFVVNDVCPTCGGAKYTKCKNCFHDGRAKCHRCRGAMEVECPMCHGHRTIASGGGRKTCPKCNGGGRAPCHVCNGRGFVKCKVCGGDGRINCKACNASGWSSLIGTLIVRAKCSWWYDKDALIKAEESPELPPLIDERGPRMVLEGHARITINEDLSRLKELDQEARPDEFKIPYKVGLPWGNISFRLKDRIIHGKLFGLLPELVHMDPFLEEPLKPALAQLEEAAKSPAMAASLIKEASKLRAIGEAVVLAARMGHAKALEGLQKRYPFGLKPETLRQMLINADVGLKNVTKKPRTNGLIIGSLMSAALMAAVYATPLRSYLYPLIPRTEAHIAVDVLVLVICAALTWMTIQTNAATALRLTLAHILTPEKLKTITPKSGMLGWAGCAAAFVIWCLMIPLSTMAGQTAPDWFIALLGIVAPL